ncbi:MAG: efflux RND transporter permease subunit [Dermatophilaceae bacterium]|nr:efflux RND transporter permease subunit [Actinomycetales bacterium]
MHALSVFSLRNRALTALLTVFLMVGGLYAVSTLKRELIPSISFPVMGVVTSVPGAGAAVVEQRVTRPMEGAVLGLRGVDKVTSTSSDSLSIVMVTLAYGEDLSKAQNDAQRAILNLRNLPEGANPQVITGSIADFPIIQMSMAGGADQQDLLAKVRAQVVPAIEGIAGVRSVQVSGVADQVIVVDLDQAKLADARVSPAALTTLLQTNGIAIPAGTVSNGQNQLSVQVGSPITSIEQLAALPLPTTPVAEASPVTLGDIAEVTLQDASVTSLSRTDGVPSLTIAVVKTPDGNTVAISHELTKLRPDLERMVTSGKTQVVYDQAPFIEESVKDLASEGMLGLAFAVLVVFLFLLSVRLTLVTAVSIPLSLLIALLGLRTGGFTLNILTLGALTIAVGRVVDDSIVVIENIERHLRMGQTRREAIPAAVREVATAVTSSTLATVAVFVPLALVGGQVGELFRPFALTVTMAMMASLFVALTIVPVLGYWFLNDAHRHRGRHAAPAVTALVPDAHGTQASETEASGTAYPNAVVSEQIPEQTEPVTRLQSAYLPALGWVLRRPVVTVLLGVLLLAMSGAAAGLLKTDFIGNSGSGTLTMSQKLPAGTSLAQTDAAAKELEKALAGRPDVKSYQVTVGSSGPLAAFTGGGANNATFTVTATKSGETDALVTHIREYADARPGLGTVTVSTGGGPTGSTNVQVVVKAPDDATLREAARIMTEAVGKVKGARDVVNDVSALIPTVVVDVDRNKAQALGLNEAAVGGLVASALRGTKLGEVALNGVAHTVTLRQGVAPGDVAALSALPLAAGPGGAPITLSQVASVKEIQAPASLSRTDGARTATISATPTSDDLGAVTAALTKVVSETTLPAGATAKVGGVSADQAQAFGQLGLALLVAIAITYAILVATFGSLLQPLVLMVSIPFAATGAIGLLLVTRKPLGVASMIGLLMLVGIVVTNAIVLIDLVNQYRSRGLSIHDAIVEGARHRLRPIIMTALATILALVPMAMSLTGGGAFISQPLALVVIGGLFSSTVLTLLIVPALYLLLERARQKRGYGADQRGLF